MATADQPKAHDNALLPFPPFFPYPHDADNSQPPYMMAFAPGMVYAYPPPAAGLSSTSCPASHSLPPTAPSLPPALPKPKRKQVKMAVRFLPLLPVLLSPPPVHQLRCSVQKMRRVPPLRALPQVRRRQHLRRRPAQGAQKRHQTWSLQTQKQG